NVEQPDPDPLASCRYSCIYWVDHLRDWNLNHYTDHRGDLQDGDVLQDGGVIDEFLRKKFLYWLEALSLCENISGGVISMAKLEALTQVYLWISDAICSHADETQGKVDISALTELVRDARRFIMYHKQAIEKSPLQVYASALIFSPARSLIKGLF